MGVVLIPWLVGLSASWLREGTTTSPIVLGASVLLMLVIGVPAIAIASSFAVRLLGPVFGAVATVALFALLCAPRFGLLRLHFESLGFKRETPVSFGEAVRA